MRRGAASVKLALNRCFYRGGYFMKRVAVCLIVIFVISTFAPVAGKGNGQQNDNPKVPKTDKLGVLLDDKPKGKFRKVEADAVPGQYLVYLTDNVNMEDIEQVS